MSRARILTIVPTKGVGVVPVAVQRCKRLVAVGVMVVAALTVVFGSGPAGAVNEFVGQTYEKAAARISSWGATAVIATRVGDYLPLDQCVVVGSRKGVQGSGKMLLDLNCNDTSAVDGHPGNSVSSPEGQAALLLKRRAASQNSNYEKSIAAGKTPDCFVNAGSTKWCIDLCETSRACSPELSKALGL